MLAAARAGYPPEGTALLKLMDRGEIRKEIAQLSSAAPLTDEIRTGLRRMAFGSNADAIKLLISGEELTPDEIDGMDLFNISEIKRPKGGGLEIKFYDRLKAMECLGEALSSSDTQAGALIEALSKAAREDE